MMTESCGRSTTHRFAAGNPSLGSIEGVTAAPGAARRKRRRHPAIGARIATAGASIAAMFAIVATLGARTPPPEAVASESSSAVVTDPGAGAAQTVTVSELSNQPILLTAKPIVRAEQPASTTPVARTNGSR